MIASRWRRYAAEAAGTFALVTIGCGAAIVATTTHAFGHAGVALAFGLVVTFIVASSGHLGGAHVNPAVTIGFWSVRRFPGHEVVPYVAAQCVGAVVGSALLGWLLGPTGGFGATVPALPIAQTFVIEMGFTGVLGFVIMAVVTDTRSPAAIAPFVLGATVFAGALVAGPLTGGSFNPARTLGPAVIGGVWRGHWLYWAAPTLGMVLGMRLYDVLRPATAPPPPVGLTGTQGLVELADGAEDARED